MKRRDSRGFTLIELLGVIVIIGIISGAIYIGVPNFEKKVKRRQ